MNDATLTNDGTNQPRKLSRDFIRTQNANRRRDTVWIEQWQANATLEVMTGAERDAYEAEITGTRIRQGDNTRTLNLANIRARLVARCLIDPDTGDRLYDWRQPKDLDELGATDSAVLDQLFTAASQLNGITKKDIDELTKNSNAEANGVSGLN